MSCRMTAPRRWGCLFVSALLATAGAPALAEEAESVPLVVHTAEFTGREDTPLRGTIRATSRAGERLSFSVAAAPRHGVLALDAQTGTFEFVPAQDFFGADTFAVVVGDGSRRVDATFTLKVEAVNDSPSAPPFNLRGPEDETLRGQVLGTDVDGDAIEYQVARPPQHGTVTLDPRSGELQYTPKKDFYGDDRMSVLLSDGDGKAEVQVSIVVDPVNDAPVVAPSVLQGREDTPAKGKVTAVDVERDTLRFRVADPPIYGQVSLDPATGAYVYTPRPDHYGEDRFSVLASDGSAEGGAAIEVRIEAVNDPPRLSDLVAEGNEDTSLRVTLVGSDADGDTLLYRVRVPPKKGSAITENNTLRYSPMRDFHGEDEMTIEVSDGRATSSALLRVRILPVNDPPIPAPTSLVLEEDIPLEWRFAATDVDGDALSWSLTRPPMHGAVNVLDAAAGRFRVIPHADYEGNDSFEIAVQDGTASAAISIPVVIKPVNDPPTLSVPKVTLREDQSIEVTVSGQDVDGDALRYRVVQPPRQGRVEFVEDQRFRYSPKPDFFGIDGFVVEVSDGRLPATATVDLEVEPVNDPPAAGPFTTRTQEDTPTELLVRTSDKDGDVVRVSVKRAARHGEATFDDTSSALRYVPNANFAGSDDLVLALTDGVATVEVPVSVEVLPVNDSPTAAPLSLEGKEDVALQAGVDATDIDGDALQFRVKTKPSHGSVELDGKTGAFVYSPERNFFGEDQFGVEVTDGKTPIVVEVRIKLAAVNDPPTTAPVSWGLREDEAKEFELRAVDPDGEALRWKVEMPPPRGVLELLDERQGRVRYTPAPDDTGTLEFQMAVTDGAASVAVPVQVQISPVNDLPAVTPLRLSTREDLSVEGQLEARDVDGDPLAFALKRQAKQGEVEVEAGTGRIRYRPREDRYGADSFVIAVRDGKGETDAVVEVAIEPINDPPRASPVQVRTPEDTPWESTLSAVDPEGAALRWSVARPPVEGSLEVTDAARGRIRFVPSENFTGPVALSLLVSDGELDTAVMVELDVTPVNDAPVATSTMIETAEDQTVEGSLQGVDVEGDPLVYRVYNSPRYGRVELLDAEEGRYRYSPGPDFHGEDGFGFEVSDSQASSRAQVRVQVTPRNDPPTVSPVTLRTAEDTAARGRVQAADVDKDKLRYRVRREPLHASVTVEEETGAFLYTPALNENGEDSFDVVVSDGSVEVTTTVSVEILRVPDPPAFKELVLLAREDEELVAEVPAADPDGDRLTYRLLSTAKLGEVSLRSEGGPLVYQPRDNLHGQDELQVEASDGRTSVRGVVKIEIQPVNDVPRVAPLDLMVVEDGVVTGRLQGEDVDGDGLSYRLHSPPTLGQVTFDEKDPAQVVYRPARDQDEDVTFAVVAFDGVAASEPAWVSVHVQRTNDAPVAIASRVVADEDVPLPIQLEGTDADGDPLQFDVVRLPVRGTLHIEDRGQGRVLFTPEKDYYGKDSFSFRVRDPDGLESTAMVRVTIEPVNDPPVAIADATDAPRFGRITRRLNGYDPEGKAITYRIVKQPRGGRVSLDDATTGDYTFAANGDASSRLQFEFVVSDGESDSSPAVVEIRLK